MGTLLNYRVTPKCINAPLNTFSSLLHRFIEIYLHVPNTFKLFFKLATNKLFLLVFFLKKKKGKKSIICSCRRAYIHTDTNKGDAFVSKPQGRQYPKSSQGFKQRFALAEKWAM